MPPVAPSATPQLPDENIRMALEAYYRELAKLQQSGGSLPNFPNLPGLIALQQQAVLNGAQDLSVKKEQQQLLQDQQQHHQQQLQQQQQQPQPVKMNGQHSLSVDEVSKRCLQDSAGILAIQRNSVKIHKILAAPATIAAFPFVGIQLSSPKTRARHNTNDNRIISCTKSTGQFHFTAGDDTNRWLFFGCQSTATHGINNKLIDYTIASSKSSQ